MTPAYADVQAAFRDVEQWLQRVPWAPQVLGFAIEPYWDRLSVVLHVRDKRAADTIPRDMPSPRLHTSLRLACVEDKRRFVGQRNVNAGDATSHACGGAGIVGLAVRSTEDTAPLFLSCAHVFAPRDKVIDPVGNNVIASPAAASPCAVANRIGTLRRFSPFTATNTIDAATCTIDSGITAAIGVVDGTPITGILDPRPSVTQLAGRKVWRLNQFGQRTDGTLGSFVARNIDFLDGMGQTPFTSVVVDDTPNAPGDSGGAVIDTLTGKLIGLHFAGDSGGGGLLCLAYLVFPALHIAYQ